MNFLLTWDYSNKDFFLYCNSKQVLEINISKIVEKNKLSPIEISTSLFIAFREEIECLIENFESAENYQAILESAIENAIRRKEDDKQ